MRTHEFGRVLFMLALVALMLAACQPAAATVAPVETQAPAATVLPAEPTAVAPTAAVPPAAPTADAGVPPTGAQAPEGWNELTDAANGYSVAYPPVWEICQEQAASRIFCVNTFGTPSAKMGWMMG